MVRVYGKSFSRGEPMRDNTVWVHNGSRSVVNIPPISYGASDSSVSVTETDFSLSRDENAKVRYLLRNFDRIEELLRREFPEDLL